MPRQLTVFLCGTYQDLAEERERILDAVRRLQLQHDSMEFFGARDDLPIETCLEEVRRSDVLIVVVGHRYGSLIPERKISFSEAEYREGQRLGKPCLVYVRDESTPVLPRHFERDPEKLRLLERWKDALSTRHTIARFSDAQGLALQVAADLSRAIQALEKTKRARSINAQQSSEVEALIDGAVERGIPGDSLVAAFRRAVADLLGLPEERDPLGALRQIANELREPAIRTIRRELKKANLHQPHHIEEVLQESQVKIYLNLLKDEKSIRDINAYFLSVCRNTARRYMTYAIRTNRLERQWSEVLEGQADLPGESLLDERSLLLKALSKLSPKSRRILELIYIEGLDPKEVRSLFGYTVDAYRNHVHRALNGLREALKEQLSN